MNTKMKLLGELFFKWPFCSDLFLHKMLFMKFYGVAIIRVAVCI